MEQKTNHVQPGKCLTMGGRVRRRRTAFNRLRRTHATKGAGVVYLCALLGYLALSSIVTNPVSPSNFTKSPVFINCVPLPVPTTVGSPYSLATIAA